MPIKLPRFRGGALKGRVEVPILFYGRGDFSETISIEFKIIIKQNIEDKFGESLGGESGSPELLESPRTSPEVPRTSPEVFGDFPGSSLTVELNSNPEVPRKFPRLPRKFPGLPWKFPGLPPRSAVSLGSLTPSSDSQELSLRIETSGDLATKSQAFEVGQRPKC